MPGYGGLYAQTLGHAAWGGPLGLTRHEMWSSLEAILFPLAALTVLVLLVSAAACVNRLGARRRRLSSNTVPSSSSAANVRVFPARPVLASEDERDGTLRTISHAVGEGRLDLDEAGRRIDAVLRSRHRHELAVLTDDLPVHVPAEPGCGHGGSWLRLALLASAAVCILAAAVLQAAAGLWELWPVAVAACGVWAARPRR